MATAASLLKPFLSFSNIPEDLPKRFTKASEIPAWCADLTRILMETPLISCRIPCESRFLNVDCRILPLEWGFAKILEIFSRNIKGNIRHFGSEPRRLCILPEPGNDSKLLRIEEGAYLPTSKTACSSLDLEKSYRSVLMRIGTGWASANDKYKPGMQYKCDPSEFELFAKKRSVHEEDCLIRFIAAKLSLTKDVECYGSMLTYGEGSNREIYLWVRKSAMKNVEDVLGFILPVENREDASSFCSAAAASP